MSKSYILKTLVNERLTAAAEDIFALFERTIAEYEEELSRSKDENQRKQRLLDSVLSPRVPDSGVSPRVPDSGVSPRVLPLREDVQIQTEQQEELSQEVTRVVVKSEYEDLSDDEDDEAQPPCSGSAQQETEANQSQQPAAARSTNNDTSGSAEVDKTNECPVCTRNLGHRQDLVHTGDKPYGCSVCEKRLRQKSTPKTHVVIHTDAVEEFLQQIQTNDNGEEARAEGRSDGVVQSSSPEIQIVIEDEVCHMDSDKDAAAQNSNNYIQPEFPAKAGPSLDHDELLKELNIKEEQLQEFSSTYVKSEEQSMHHQTQTEHGEEADIDYDNWIQSWEPPAGSSHEPAEQDEVGPSFIQSMLSTNNAVTKKKHPVKKGVSDMGAKTTHECSVCKKKLGRKQELKRHMLLHTGEKPFSCPVCEKRFIQKSNLKSHIVTHLDSVDTFLRHQKPSEKDVEGEGLSTNSMDNSSDTDDDEAWNPPASTSSLHTEAEADGDRNSQDQIKDKSTDGQNPFPFFKSFQEARDDQSTLELLNQALNESKERGKTTEYQCPICTKTFGRMENLRRHLLIHTGEKPFSCTVCNKCFTLKQHLKLHMVVHTGEKQFNCSICTRTFNRKDNLRSHMKVHSIDRPFGCSECGARFNLNKNLMRHMAVHAGQTPYSCTVCNSGFSSQLCLKRHEKIHIKDTPK